jgi:hypothetical protein
VRQTQELSILQKLSIYIAIKQIGKGGNGVIMEIGTGEGKSLIIAGIAAIMAKKKFRVDIITSSSVFAIRDAIHNEPIFAKM